MVGTCPRQDEYELRKETEAALSSLDALFSQLFVDGPYNAGDLRLEQGNRATRQQWYVSNGEQVKLSFTDMKIPMNLDL